MNKKTIRIEVTEEENVFLLRTPDGGKPSKFKLTDTKPAFSSYRKQAWAWQVVKSWRATTLKSKRPTSLKKLLKNGYLEAKVDDEIVENNVKSWKNWARWEKMINTEHTEIVLNSDTYVIVDPCYLTSKPELLTARSEIYGAAELVGGGAHWYMLEGDGSYPVYNSNSKEEAGVVSVDSGTMVAIPANKFELKADCKYAFFTTLQNVQKVIIAKRSVIFVCQDGDYKIKM